MEDALLHSEANGQTFDPEASFRPTEKKKHAQKSAREEKANRPKQNVATATSVGTDRKDHPSHTILATSSSSHVPVPVPQSANYGLAPASQPLPLFPLPNQLGSTDANCSSVPLLHQPSSSGMACTSYRTTPTSSGIPACCHIIMRFACCQTKLKSATDVVVTSL